MNTITINSGKPNQAEIPSHLAHYWTLPAKHVKGSPRYAQFVSSNGRSMNLKIVAGRVRVVRADRHLRFGFSLDLALAHTARNARRGRLILLPDAPMSRPAIEVFCKG